jgi:hypothetical protein
MLLKTHQPLRRAASACNIESKKTKLRRSELSKPKHLRYAAKGERIVATANISISMSFKTYHLW